MYMQEQFFKDQIKVIHDSRDEREEDFERMQQEEREKVKQSSTTGHANAEEYRLKYVTFIPSIGLMIYLLFTSIKFVKMLRRQFKIESLNCFYN